LTLIPGSVTPLDYELRGPTSDLIQRKGFTHTLIMSKTSDTLRRAEMEGTVNYFWKATVHDNSESISIYRQHPTRL
jgi:hypothetical protein